MERIWAPWRLEYITAEKVEGCIFCLKPKERRDSQNYILYRGQSNFIIMNAYPYNPGHVMVAPYRHVAGLEELTDEELFEHSNMVTKSIRALRETLSPTGFNIGMNIGKVAGAGIEDHIHTHLVPRWQGDTNFMSVISGTKVMPEALASAYARLKKSLA